MKYLLKIKHLFTGHSFDFKYDEKYIYCACDEKYRHHNSSLIKDWVFPYIDEKIRINK